MKPVPDSDRGAGTQTGSAGVPERVWALRDNLTGYDAWYVALAEALDCPIVTLDRRLSRANGPTCDIITPPRQRTP